MNKRNYITNTTTKKVHKFQRLFPNREQLVDARMGIQFPKTRSIEYLWIYNYLMVTGPLVVELTLVKCDQSLVVTMEQTLNPKLTWPKAVVFKINSDDDDEIYWCKPLFWSRKSLTFMAD